MKDFKTRVLYPTFLLFSIITIIFASIAALYTPSTPITHTCWYCSNSVECSLSGQANYAPTLDSLLVYLAFSFVISRLNQIFYLKKPTFIIRLILHYLGSITAFVLAFVVLRGNFSYAKGALYIILFYSIIYFIAAAIIYSVKSRVAHAKRDA